MELVLRWTISSFKHQDMSQRPDPPRLLACEGDGENGTARAAASADDSSSCLSTATSLSFDKIPNPINPEEASVAPSTQPDSPRCASPTSTHPATDVPRAALFTSSAIIDCPDSAQHEVRIFSESQGLRAVLIYASF